MASIKRPVLAALATALTIPAVALLAVGALAAYEAIVPPAAPGFVTPGDLVWPALNWGSQGATAAFAVLAPLLWLTLDHIPRPRPAHLLALVVIALVPAWLLAGERNFATAALMLVWVPPCWSVLWWTLRR